MTFFTKLWNGVLALFGRKPTPAQPPDLHTEIQMAWEKTTAAIAQLQSLLSLAAAASSASASALSAAEGQVTSLQGELDAADTQIETELQPVITQAQTLVPPPPPPPPPPPAA